MYKKGGPLNLLTWLKGGYLKNMSAISGGLEKIWNKKQFLLHPPLQLKLWLVPKRPILGDPGAVSRVDKMFVVKVYSKL